MVELVPYERAKNDLNYIAFVVAHYPFADREADRNRSVLFLQPRVDSAGDVFHAGESVFPEQSNGFRGAHAGLAVDEDFPVLRQGFQLIRQSSQWNQTRFFDAGCGMFVRLADINEQSFEISR